MSGKKLVKVVAGVGAGLLLASTVSSHSISHLARTHVVHAEEIPGYLSEESLVPDDNLRALIKGTLGIKGRELNREDLKGLTRLSGSSNGIKSLEGLEFAENLNTLNLNRDEIEDLSPLANLTKLKTLGIVYSKINDISPLKGLSNLTSLNLVGNKIKDITPLKELSKLSTLQLGFNEVEDISSLEGLYLLEKLGLAINKIEDMSPLNELENLTDLILIGNKIQTITPLKLIHNPASGVRLSLSSNQITDISLLGGKTNISMLDVYDNFITEMPSFVGSTALRNLDLSNNQITNISPLPENIGYVNLSNNQIEDLSQLPENIGVLYLSDNKIKDISSLPKNIYELNLSNNQIKDISTLSDYPNLCDLHLSNNQIINFDVLNGFDVLNDPYLFYSPDTLSLDNQNVVLDDVNVDKNSDGFIEIDFSSIFGEVYEVDLDNDGFDKVTRKLKVSENEISNGNLNLKFLIKYKGNFEQDIVVNVTQPVNITGTIPKPKTEIITKNQEVEYDSDWDNRMGFVSAVKDGKNYEYEEIEKDGPVVDTKSPGDYTVNYWFTDDSDTKYPAVITVKEKSPDTDPGDGGDGDDGDNGNTGNGSDNSSNIKDIDETNIMTDQKSLDIYNVSGNKTGEKKLTKQTTDFKTNKLNTVGKNEYYQIGDNEWVKKDDVKVFYYNNSYVQTHRDSIKELTKFRNSGKVQNRALEKMTDWYTDRYAYFQGEWHHRVATHEWVHADHVVEYKKITGTVHANEVAQLYTSKGKKSNRALKDGYTFVTDKTATINGKLMYRVATDEWVPAELVTFE
ncbi:leucine-rich repeat domain-containing protein [Companilactobacillus hulinensis]|uniref:leucine-rich repeat domain-containing protein n=1 Tax=Companilactobacillus hulinensis TaxID=2486007 RepID=UPI000F7A6576|nr:leucine-rich repeat domain-containing protein [Companilactobacillus hulinensis]